MLTIITICLILITIALVFGEESAQGCCGCMVVIGLFALYGIADFLGFNLF
tara:strand:+ start:204 stop:356 length:153 start_codon:yes stop_codon:yes gene_type:complete